MNECVNGWLDGQQVNNMMVSNIGKVRTPALFLHPIWAQWGVNQEILYLFLDILSPTQLQPP